MLFLDALSSREDIEKAATALAAEQVLFSWGEGGLTPPTTLDQLRGWGFSVVIFPVAALLASVSQRGRCWPRSAATGRPIRAMEGLPNLKDFFGLIGLDEVDDLGEAVRPRLTAVRRARASELIGAATATRHQAAARQ